MRGRSENGTRICAGKGSVDTLGEVALLRYSDNGAGRFPRRGAVCAFAVISLAVLLTAFLPGAIQADDGEAGPRGAELLAPFKRKLKAALQSGMAEGPVAAIAVCRVKAPEIAAAQSGDGLLVGRSSHRLRNPANAPPEWVGPILDSYLADAGDRAPRSMTLKDNRAGYVEPILVQPLCLTCHGENLAPDVAERIAALYPEDQAVGFSEGDLRGVFWVEFEVE